MSWYTIPPAEYVILALKGLSSSDSNESIRPCDVRNNLIGFKVGTKQPFNEVRYPSNNSAVIIFEVVEISIGRMTQSFLSNIEAVVTRNTQIFLVRSGKSKNYRMLCFSPGSSSWHLDVPYSESDCLVALKLHDPTVVSSMIGNIDIRYFNRESETDFIFLFCKLV